MVSRGLLKKDYFQMFEISYNAFLHKSKQINDIKSYDMTNIYWNKYGSPVEWTVLQTHNISTNEL